MTDDETTVPAEGNNERNKNDSMEPQAPVVVPAAPVVPVTPIEPLESPTPPQNDFTKILKEIKIPERRDFKAAADVAQAPTSELGAAILEEHIIKKAAALEEKSETASAPIEEPPAKERSSAIVTPVRTLKDDLQTVVREQKISLVHAATLEEEKKHGQEHLAPEQKEIRARKSRRTTGIVFASALLVLLGLGAILGVLFVMQEQQSTPQTAQPSILFAEQTLAFPLDNQNSQTLKSQLTDAKTKQLGSLGSILRVVPTIESTSTNAATQEGYATVAQFFASLGIHPPQELMAAIGPEFFFGFHVVDTNAPLLVIPITSYDHAFAGMLAWEPNMDTDLSPIFSSVSMTVATSGIPVERAFQDAVMRNYDVRELTDDSGNIVLYYSFPTPNILVIAQSPYSFTEILSRLQAEREL